MKEKFENSECQKRLQELKKESKMDYKLILYKILYAYEQHEAGDAADLVDWGNWFTEEEFDIICDGYEKWKKSYIPKTQTEFTCKCGKQKGWIGNGDVTDPCPECGRSYHGFEKVDRNGVTQILAKEIK